MQRVFLGLLTALAVVALPQYAAAQDGKRPDRPRPEARPERPNPDVIFARLDANHDGVITLKEIPPGMPEPLKQLLVQAIKKHDGKLTKAELIETMKLHRSNMRPGSGPPPWQHAQSFAHQKGGAEGHHMAMPTKAAGPQTAMFNARAIFNRLDTNHDGKLSFEEFAAGLHQLHQFVAMRASMPQMPMPGQMVRHARDKMFAYGAEFAKTCFANGPQHGHCCPHCGAAMKGPQHRGPDMWARAYPNGRQWTGHHHGHQDGMARSEHDPWHHGEMGWNKHHQHHGDMGWCEHHPWHHGEMGWNKHHHRHHGEMGWGEYGPKHHGEMGWAEYGPRHHDEMEWAQYGPRHHDGLGWDNGPMHFAGREMADGPHPVWFEGPGHDGAMIVTRHRDWSDGRQGPESRQRSDGWNRPEGKRPDVKKSGAKKPEVRLGGERQDFEVRLAALERQQAQILSLLKTIASEHATKELARGGKDFRHGERRPSHEDRD